MKKIALLLITIITMIACSDKTYNTQKNLPKATAVKNSSGDLVGVANRESFTNDEDYKNWFNTKYEQYTPDTEAIAIIEKNSNDITIKAFMGTWCGDSKREVPRFYKILDNANIDENKMKMIALNRSKQANGLEIDIKNGKNRVPTFIFYRNGTEIGRFIERTSGGKTLEQMIADILK